MNPWNMGGELLISKNIMLGWYSPHLVLNAAFHWSPSLIRMLLYPHHTSNFEYTYAPPRSLMSVGISGSVYWFLTVQALRAS